MRAGHPWGKPRSWPGGCLAFCLLALALMPLPSLQAQERSPSPEENTIHWAYSAFLGTGWYQVSRELDVYVLRAPLSWNWRETGPVAAGWRGAGVTFDFPITFGLYQLDDLDDLVDFDNVGTVSFTPGVEFEWNVNEKWALRAYGHAGWGVDTTNEEDAWMWDLGLRSRYAPDEAQRWGLFTEVFTAGYRPDDGASSTLGGYGAGLEYHQPVPWTSNAGEPLHVAWDLAYRWYGDELTFNTRRQFSTAIDDEWRLGIALALRDRRMRFWWFEFDQLGLAFRTSSDGEFRALTFNISGPFRR